MSFGTETLIFASFSLKHIPPKEGRSLRSPAALCVPGGHSCFVRKMRLLIFKHLFHLLTNMFYSANRLTTTTELWPPKPSDVEMAALISPSWPTFGT